MTTRFERVLLSVLTIAATAIAVAMVKREFFSNRGGAGAPPVSNDPRYIERWQDVLRNGIELGDPEAPIKLVEFTDLECPFCKRFHLNVVRDLLERYPGKVSPVFVHFPLSFHRFAEPSAKAAECAHQQEAFAELVAAVYAQQDSLGLRPWSMYAVDAMVADTVAFNACVRSREQIPRIAAGKRIGEALGINGTPGIMLNGWLYPSPPTVGQLSRVIDSVLSRRDTSRAR